MPEYQVLVDCGLMKEAICEPVLRMLFEAYNSTFTSDLLRNAKKQLKMTPQNLALISRIMGYIDKNYIDTGKARLLKVFEEAI